ncbi:MAG: TIGR04076 family protein [Clostridia bacterium]|nr:TIGR04076 family protein [Clostridia bacterium]
MARVLAEVVEVRGSGECSAGHKVGDRLVFAESKAPAMCPWALGTLIAPVAVLLNGGRFPWAGPDEPTVWCCPDPADTVVFRLTREE